MLHAQRVRNFFARLPDWFLPCALVVGAAFIYFARALAPGMTIFANDMDFAYSTQMLLAEQLRAGTLPFWHPYVSSGMPLFTWAPLFYPPHLAVALFLPLDQNFAWAFVFHFALAGIGIYFFLKQIHATTLGAVMGALAYIFNGYLILRIFAGHFMYVYAAAWIPAIFLFAEKSIGGRRPVMYATACGIALGLQMQSAVFQIWLYTVLMLFVYSLVRIVTLYFEENRRMVRASATRVSMVIIAIAIGLGIGAVYWIPAVETVSASLRGGGLDFLAASAESFPPTHLLTLLVPNFFGTDIDQNYWGYFLGYISQIESGIYIGVIPAILALTTLRFWRQSQVLALWVVAVCALTLAFGRFTPFFRLVYDLIPGMNSFRIPARMLILFCFAMTALFGVGLSELEKNSERFKRMGLILIAVGGVIAVLWAVTRVGNASLIPLGKSLARALYSSSADRTRPVEFAFGIIEREFPGLPDNFILPALVFLVAGSILLVCRANPRLALSSFALVILLDLAWFGWRYLVVIPSVDILRPDQVKLHAYLDSPDSGRVYGEDTLIATNMGNVFGFANVQGGFPQTLERYRDLINYGIAESLDPVLDLGFFKQFNPRALSLFNTTTALTLTPIDSPGWEPIGHEQVTILASDRAASDYLVPQPATAYVYKNTNALPRAFVVYDARVIAEDAVALAALYREDFDPARTVILDQPTGALGAGGKSNVEIQRYTPNQIELRASTDVSGILVLSEVFAPGWTATIDNQSAPVLRADYALRGVYLPVGSHQVQFNYSPPGLMLGMMISLSALFVSVVIAWLAA